MSVSRPFRGGFGVPGKIADFSLLDSDVMDDRFKIEYVWKNGRQIVRDNEVYHAENYEHIAPAIKIRVKKIPDENQIKVKCESDLINVFKD